MVAETQRTFDTVMEQTAESTKALMNAGLRAHRAWLDAVGECWKRTGGMPAAGFPTEKGTKEFAPFVRKNVQAVTECFETGFRAGLDVFRTACDAATHAPNGDFTESTRQVWDAAFSAIRENAKALEHAAQQTADNWTTFCTTACVEQDPGRNPSRTAAK